VGGYTYRHTDLWLGFVTYAVEMGSGALIQIPSFIKTDSGIEKLNVGDTQAHKHDGDPLSLLLFFQNKESRLKKFKICGKSVHGIEYFSSHYARDTLNILAEIHVDPCARCPLFISDFNHNWRVSTEFSCTNKY
jgi:hypothetical protein